jgi:hypothetical protein
LVLLDNSRTLYFYIKDSEANSVKLNLSTVGDYQLSLRDHGRPV